jgi:hypothetical protein
MRADPEPLKPILAFNCESAVAAAHAHGPEVTTDPLEMQRGMSGIAFEQRSSCRQVAVRRQAAHRKAAGNLDP